MSDELATLYARRFDVDVTNRHNEAMAYRDLESILGVGVLCFNDIRKRHGDWLAQVESKSIAYRVEDAERLADDFAKWKAATEFWLPIVEHFEQQGYQVEYAASIRQYYELIRLSDLDVRDTLAAYERLEKAGGVPWEDVYAGLTQRQAS
jgi:hypothetical protein